MEKSQVTENLLEEERLLKRGKLPGWVGRLCFIGATSLAFLLVGLALLPRLQFFAENMNRWLPYPYFRAGSEGLMLSEAAIVRAGGSLYVPLRPDQFISGPYPPLYYYLLAALWPVGQGAAAGFTAGRVISLVAALLAACSIIVLVFIESRLPRPVKLEPMNIVWLVLAGLAAGALFLSMPAVTVWAARVRADMLMVGLQMVGLTLVAWKPRSWPAFLALLPLTLAFYTKHTGLAAPAAATVFILLQNLPQWKRALTWLGSFAAALTLPFLLLNLLTGFEFYRRLFPYHDLGRDDRNFERYLNLFWQENAALLIMGAILFGFTIYDLRFTIRRSRSPESSVQSPQSRVLSPESKISSPQSWLHQPTRRGAVLSPNFFSPILNLPLVIWFFLFSLPLLWGMGVVGTDHNHFLPAEAAGCAVAGVLTGRWLGLPSTNKGRWLGLLALAGLWVQATFCAIPAPRYEIEFRQENADYQSQLGKIVQNAASQPKPILTSEAAFLAFTDRPFDHYYYNDLFTISALARQGRYDLNGLLNAVRNKEFGLILVQGDFFSGEGIRSDVWPPALVEAIKSNYKLKFHDIWSSYEPT